MRDDALADYYQDELQYLRTMGQRFAKAHPKIARRLALNDNQSTDPHVERILESFALHVARLRHSLDAHYPEIATALLEALYPHLLRPVPSMGIVRLPPIAKKVTGGYLIPRHTQLLAHAEQDIICRFRTVYPLTLWPVCITDIRYLPAEAVDFKGKNPDAGAFICVTLTGEDAGFDQSCPPSLRFHIRGMVSYVLSVYESIMAHPHRQAWIAIKDARGRMVAEALPQGSIKSVGFAPDEVSLPLPAHSLHGHQLIQEYFHFQDKFMFFEVTGLETLQNRGLNQVDILIPLANAGLLSGRSAPKDLLELNCVPAVNLFTKKTDPLRLDHRHVQYRLIPDSRRERTTEIYSIERVYANLDDETRTAELPPYYSLEHAHADSTRQLFWTAKRRSAQIRDVPGTDVYLSFVDQGFNPRVPDLPVIFADTLCTNRYLAKQLHADTLLQTEESFPVKAVAFTDHVTEQAYPPQEGASLWRLVSQLAVNHLSMTHSDQAIHSLRELLQIYAACYPFREWRLAEDLQSIRAKPIVRRLGTQAWRGFVQGMEVTLDIAMHDNASTSNFLLGAVLREYLSLQVQVNSFVEMVLYDPQQRREWMRWQPSIGMAGQI